MSSVATRCGLAAWLLLASVPALAGQTPEEQARIDRLARRYDALSVRLTAGDKSDVPRVDSMDVGMVRILSDSIESPALREAASALDRLLRDRVGPAVLPDSAPARV